MRRAAVSAGGAAAVPAGAGGQPAVPGGRARRAGRERQRAEHPGPVVIRAVQQRPARAVGHRSLLKNQYFCEVSVSMVYPLPCEKKYSFRTGFDTISTSLRDRLFRPFKFCTTHPGRPSPSRQYSFSSFALFNLTI